MAVDTPQKSKGLKRPRDDTPEKHEAPPTLPELVKRLREEYVKSLKDVKSMCLEAGNKETEVGQVPPQAKACFFCGRAKHSCSWQYRSTEDRLVTGSTCTCCSEACKRLKSGSRSTRALEKVGLKPAVVEVSKFLQVSFGPRDRCVCHLCHDTKKKKGKSKIGQ